MADATGLVSDTMRMSVCSSCGGRDAWSFGAPFFTFCKNKRKRMYCICVIRSKQSISLHSGIPHCLLPFFGMSWLMARPAVTPFNALASSSCHVAGECRYTRMPGAGRCCIIFSQQGEYMRPYMHPGPHHPACTWTCSCLMPAAPQLLCYWSKRFLHSLIRFLPLP